MGRSCSEYAASLFYQITFLNVIFFLRTRRFWISAVWYFLWFVQFKDAASYVVHNLFHSNVSTVARRGQINTDSCSFVVALNVTKSYALLLRKSIPLWYINTSMLNLKSQVRISYWCGLKGHFKPIIQLRYTFLLLVFSITYQLINQPTNQSVNS